MRLYYYQTTRLERKASTISKATRPPRGPRKEQLDKLQNAKDEDQQAFGTYGTTEELVYREKTEHGSYRIKRVKVQEGQSRGDLLSMVRAKQEEKRQVLLSGSLN
jgi:hypothetical protein